MERYIKLTPAYEFNTSLFRAAQPKTLREFSERVLYKPLPSLEIRAQWWYALSLGEKDEYLGSDLQNELMLNVLAQAAQK